MYGDYSRFSFNRANHYTAVWSQQARTLLDADFNEQTAIMLDWMRTLAIDFIGPAGGHILNGGFDVTVQGDDLVLSPGHYYVFGIRCEVPAVEAGGTATTYKSLEPKAKELPSEAYLVYLTVWERSVNSLRDPNLLEPALGPMSPDTTTRTQVAWSLDFTKPPQASSTAEDPVDTLFGNMNNPHQPNINDPAQPAPLLLASMDTSFTGLENQLYRVEIHRGSAKSSGGAGPTFKWSRDNASIEFAFASFGIDKLTDGTIQSTVTLSGSTSAGRPQLEVGDCVEVIDKSWKPFGEPDSLLTVVGVDRVAGTVTLDGAINKHTTQPAVLRRWDGGSGDGISITPAAGESAIPLENGIQIEFSPAGAFYQRGDYWLIAARAATGLIYGPTIDDPGAPPYGPARHYAPLAQIDSTGKTDLRSRFTHLAWPDMTAAPS
jgi:hypothetical protein